MKKTIVLLMAVCCLLVSCGKDDTQGSKKGRDFLDGTTWVFDWAAKHIVGGDYTFNYYIKFSSGKATITTVTGPEDVESLGTTSYTLLEDNWIVFSDYIPLFPNNSNYELKGIVFNKTAYHDIKSNEIIIEEGKLSGTNSFYCYESYVFIRVK